MAMVQAMRRCNAFISARLHGAIVAYMCAIPFAIVDYHPKCRDFADDVGLPGDLRIDAHATGQEAFTRMLDTLLNETASRPALSPDVYAREAQDIFQCAPWSNIPDTATRAA